MKERQSPPNQPPLLDPDSTSFPAYRQALLLLRDTQDEAGVAALSQRCMRLTDAHPMVGLMFGLWLKASQKVAEAAKEVQVSRKWSVEMLEAKLQLAKIEGSLAAYIATAEEQNTDQFLNLRQRTAMAIEVLNEAAENGKIKFENPKDLSLQNITDLLNPPIKTEAKPQ